MEKILITGATGEYGKAVIDTMIKMGVKTNLICAMARDTTKINHLERLGITTVYGDYDDYDSLFTAFDGIEKLLFVSGTTTTNRGRQHKQVVKAAKKAGVNHIVYTSQLHKTDRPDSPIKFVVNSHLETENAIKKSGMRYTILRNGLYMDLLPTFLGTDVLTKGIFLPAGEGRVAFTLRNDLAEAAAAILVSDSHKNKTYDLCANGVTFAEIAGFLSKIIDREIKYTNANYDRYIDGAVGNGTPRKMVLMLAGFAAAVAQGELNGESTNLEALLVRNPKDVLSFLKENYNVNDFK
ncbi:NAD(P)H-binding protein [Flavobacterium sp. Sd200]|uniref:SDR family oxidoreductase n=1 Tax=Flavobacterium sp. Sd200 TaxID=2692211 RepID=UPI0013707527|nr:SDR family oxidoreductase [Flavobacterium sp. Sd200]MXN92375.1 NAD(P)H-binding protein [Flavobacterium sp. Sd200]